MAMAMLLSALSIIFSIPFVCPQSDPRSLDVVLQDYAFRALIQPKTGVIYDAVPPSNLTGVQLSAIRLRSGSLRRKGVRTFKEFGIPKGLIVTPYIERLVLVYQNLGNLSTTYYPLGAHAYLAPVVGLLAYNASNLAAQNLSELGVEVSLRPIMIRFPGLSKPPGDSLPKCVSFGLNGSVSFSSVVSENICTAFELGHFSVAVEANAPSPSPKESGTKAKKWIIVGSVVGGSFLLVFLGILAIFWARRCSRKKKLRRMERAAEFGEPLNATNVGGTRAPSAMGTRTQPNIEIEYVP